ncbi:CBS domain-containing protein [Clostridia bacterium]|nr:CBS domain-containing protein [Clostridia bacterium]
MNIAFFLLPKNDVIVIDKESTIRQALEKMEYHGYTAIPVIDSDGKYVDTLTEGDILWKIKHTKGLTFETTSKYYIKDVERKRQMMAVSINSDMMDLLELAKKQNFVPVVDDQNVFIGIVRRSEIISYCFDQIK